MPRSALPLALVSLLACAHGTGLSREEAQSRYSKLENEYFAEWFAFEPTLGTQNGFHQYDPTLEDFFEQWVVIAREHAGEAAPTVGGIAQAKGQGDLAGQPAALQVFDRPLVGLELLAVMVACLVQHIGQRGLAFFQRGSFLALLRRAVVLGHRHAHLLGEVAHRIEKAHPRIGHQEAQRVAVHAAAEAMVGLPGGADREAGRLLAVERAQAFVVDAGLLELHVAAHHLDDVDAGKEVLDKGGRNHGRQFRASSRPSSRM